MILIRLLFRMHAIRLGTNPRASLMSLGSPGHNLERVSHLWSLSHLDTCQVQPTNWIVVKKILPPLCMTDIVSCSDPERAKVRAYSIFN